MYCAKKLILCQNKLKKINAMGIYEDKTYVYIQGSKGIRLWFIKCCISPMMICKITPSVDYNWYLKYLDTQLNELIKIPQCC